MMKRKQKTENREQKQKTETENREWRTKNYFLVSVFRFCFPFPFSVSVLCFLHLFISSSVAAPDNLIITSTGIKLPEGKIIGVIDIDGHYPYVETQIRKRLNLQVGDLWQEEVIEEQKERIIRFFEKKGFYNTTVEITTKPTSRENHIHLGFRIRKGDRLRYAQVVFKGNRATPSGRLVSFIRPMKIYSERRLKEKLRAMEEYYRGKGYLRARIRVTEKKVDEAKKRVWLKIKINEGPRVKVFFRGNGHYRLKTLKETITLYREGNFDSVELQTSGAAIAERLKGDGYPQAKVGFKKEKISSDLYHVTFTIKPGKPLLIQDITFVGNQVISDGKLKKQLLLKENSITQRGVFKEEFLAEDQKLAGEFYRSQGFSFAQVQEPEIVLNQTKTRYRITYPVQEGEIVLAKKIAFKGTEGFSEEEVSKDFKNEPGKPFNQTILLEEKLLVERFFKNRGYPYVQVDQSFEINDQGATISYTIDRGPLVTIGDILFVGDVLTGVKPLQNALGIQTGEPYSEKKIVEGGLNLRRLGIFNAVTVEPIGLEEKATLIHLYVKVEERKPFVLDLETQFSTDQQYAGTLKFTNFNSFGWAKQTRLSLTGGLQKDRAELAWLDPRFFGADVQMSLASWLDYEKRTIDTSIQTGGALAFFRQFRRFGFLGRYQLTKTYVTQGQSTDPNALRDNILSEVGLSGSYDIRDSFADPTRGFFTLVGGKFFNEIRGLRADFAKLRMVFSHYLSPLRRITFSSTFRIDRIQDLIRASSIPGRELFGLGGDDTIRGFREDRAGPLNAQGNPIGARTRLIFNEELQLRFFKTMQMALFYDGGTLTQAFDDINLSTYRHAFGFGLRYITPVGPIRADYGIILDKGPNENFGRFHLTFGYLF